MEPTALLVEDSRDWWRILRDELLGHGFKLDWATEREEALAKVVAPPFPYDTLIVDPNLDDSLQGQAGLMVVERAMHAPQPPRLILVSGYHDTARLTAEYEPFKQAIAGIFEKGSFDVEAFRSTLLALRGVGESAEALFQPDRDLLDALWREVVSSNGAPSTGRALEKLVVEMLKAIPLLTLRAERAISEAGEIDAVFGVAAIPATLCQEWGDCLLVECRDRASKVDAGSVSHFVAKMERVDARVGIIASMAGISKKGRASAQQSVAAAFRGDRRRVVMHLDRRDLEAVATAGANLYGILQERHMDVRLGR